MSISTLCGLGVDRPDLVALLTHWRELGVPDVPETLTASLIAGGRSNPTYLLTDGERRWVLRRPPYGAYVSSAHDMAREVRALQALQATDVPVPRVLFSCEDAAVLGAPFYVMEHLSGRTFRTQQDVSVLTVTNRGRLSDGVLGALADLHEVDPDVVAPGRSTAAEGYLGRQVARFARQWQAVTSRDSSEFDAIVRLLGDSQPSTRFPGVAHGDFKVDNVMVSPDDPGRVLAVLDWEMSTVGDTLADLGLLLSCWDEAGEEPHPISGGMTALDGFRSRADLVQMYSSRTGRDVAEIDWYTAMAEVKVAVLLEQIHQRDRDGTSVAGAGDGVGDMIQPLLARARRRLTTAEFGG